MASSATVIALLLSGSVAGGQMAGAESASAASFSDVAQSHWASKHIAKLNLQGIIKGYNGAFKPNDNVTQQEAIVMAIRFMGKENEVKQDEEIVFPDAFKVGAYFKPYVIEAMRMNLIDRDEEFKAAEADPKGEWGARKASREWVTKLIVKAIGQKEKAEEMSSAPSSFGDAKEIGAGYAGYINAAVSLELIKGVSADKFDPQGYITRASIATILSRAESKFPVAYAGQITGVLSAKSDSSISVYRDKEEKSYTVNAGTLVYRHDSEKAIPYDQLAAHTDVLAIADSAGNVLYLEQLGDTQKVEKLTGTIARIIESSNVVWIAKDNDPNPLIINYDGSLVVKDAAGATVPLASLAVDSKVDITRDTYRDQPAIVSIEVKTAPVNKTAQGVVKSVTPTTIQITNSATGEEESYPVANPVDVIWQGTIVQDLGQVRVGDTVSIEVKNSVVTRITMQQTTGKTVAGVFVGSDGKTLQYLFNGNLEAKFVADFVDVQIGGLTGPGLADLLKDDQIEITLSDKDQVTAVKVLNRQVDVLNGAVIISYDPDMKELFVRDPATQRARAVYLNDRTRIENYGTSIGLKEVAPLLVKNRKVSVGFAGDKAVFLQFVFKYTGTVMAINTASNTITLALTNGSNLTIPMQYPAVEMLGKSGATLADVKAGMTVSTMLNAEQDKVVSLQVHTANQYEIASVDASARKLRLKNTDGVTSEFTVSNWELFNDKNEKIGIGNLSAGQIVNVTYVGTTPSSLKTVPVTVGRVAAVGADKISVATYGGATVDVPLGSAYTVVKNGVGSPSASALAIGDRVEVRKDTKDQTLVNVLTGVARKFWKYDAAANEIYFKRTSINDNDYRFKPSSTAKAYEGDTPITFAQLKDGDSVQAYFYQGTLYEIVKNP